MSTGDHRGTESKVMHVRFNWTRQHMIFMKTVQHWGAAAKDQNGGILSFNSLMSAQEVLRQIPLRVTLSITEQEGYTKDSTVIAWKDLSITENSSDETLVRISYEDTDRICHIEYTEHLNDAFADQFDKIKHARFPNEATLYENCFHSRHQEVMDTDPTDQEEKDTADDWQAKKPKWSDDRTAGPT